MWSSKGITARKCSILNWKNTTLTCKTCSISAHLPFLHREAYLIVLSTIGNYCLSQKMGEIVEFLIFVEAQIFGFFEISQPVSFH